MQIREIYIQRIEIKYVVQIVEDSFQPGFFPVLQSGIIAIITVALVIVAGLVIFAVWHRLGIAKRLKKER